MRNSTFRGKLIRALDAASNKYDRPNVSNDDDDVDDHDSDNEQDDGRDYRNNFE